MAVSNSDPNEIEVVTKALSGLGVDEKSLVSTLGKWHPEQKESFRKKTQFFVEDECLFERWIDRQMEQIKQEFLRFKRAVLLWTTHPWERDARLVWDAVTAGPKSYNLVIEIACTRSSDELLGARRAYHSLFDSSIEEDVAYEALGDVEHKLLVGLVSAYRYEGPTVHEDTAKSEAETLSVAFKNAAKKNPMEDEEVVRILSTRSKLHLKSVFKHYKDISGKNTDEDLVDLSTLKHTVQCLSTPETYFINVLDAAMNPGAAENIKEGLTRVIVTRADVDMKVITEEYHKQNGVALTQKIDQICKGNFRDFLLTLIAGGDPSN